MTSRRQQQKEATARKIFEAAIQLFRDQGYEATTVEAITAAAGVAKGTFFTHFPSKDAVLEHIGQLQMGRIAADIAADSGFAERAAPAQIRFVVGVMVAGIEHQPAELRMLTIELLARRSIFRVDPQGIGALDALFEQIVAAGQARGELRADAPAARLATLVRGAYFLALFEWVQGPEQPLAPIVESHLGLVLDGIAHSG
jgi:TetR/AcrR family transcriptional regulator, cholesterol catabolism regulator